MGEPLTPSHFRVMVKLSRTLIPAASILPAVSGSRKRTRLSVVVNIIRSPYCPAMSLPWLYFKPTVTGALGGKSGA